MIPTLTFTHCRPPAPLTWPLVLPILLSSLLAAGCSVGPDPRPTNETPEGWDSSSQTAESTATGVPSLPCPIPGPTVGEVPITITMADTVMTARLADNPTARDLAQQLPLTLTFTDFNQVEKIAKLPRQLSLDGAPAGSDPDIGDIGYYAPSGDVVFYYGEVGYFNGIVGIGRFDTTMERIKDEDGPFQVRIDRA